MSFIKTGDAVKMKMLFKCSECEDEVDHLINGLCDECTKRKDKKFKKKDTK